jgi:hypothetical protein
MIPRAITERNRPLGLFAPFSQTYSKLVATKDARRGVGRNVRVEKHAAWVEAPRDPRDRCPVSS